MSDHPSPAGKIDDPAAVKRKQWFWLGSIAIGVIAVSFIGVLFTGSTPLTAPTSKPVEKIVTPGSQLSPQDSWIGSAGADIAALKKQVKELNDALVQVKGNAGATALPSIAPGITLPASAYPGLPPDATLPPPQPQGAIQSTSQGAAPGVNSAQQLLGGPRTAAGGTSAMPMPASAAEGAVGKIAPISTVDLTQRASSANAQVVTPARGADAATDTNSVQSKKEIHRIANYIPSGSFGRSVLLGGLDAPTGGQAQSNPHPVLLRVMDHAVLPNGFRGKIKDCFVVAAGYGDLSSERAMIRTESMSCIAKNGNAIDVPLKGWVLGEDGKAGLRGKLISKQGQVLANALLAGVASGIGSALQQNATTYSVSPLGSTSTVQGADAAKAGLGLGVGRALDRLSNYYISLAEKMFPVIEIDSSRVVEIVLQKGVSLDGLFDDVAGTSAEYDYSALAQRSRNSMRGGVDD
jgi:conjugal transfer pilus assembly protein TraB